MAAQGLSLAGPLRSALRAGLAAVSGALAALACSPEDGQHELEAFWTRFRQAVIEQDAEGVAALSRFPFEVRGLDDSDPIQRYDRAQFPALWERLIEQAVLRSEGAGIVPRSMRDLVVEAPHGPRLEAADASAARFEQFEFERVEGCWLFTLAYLED